MSETLAIRSGSLAPASLDFILLDGSGSMRSKWWDSLASVDGYCSVMHEASMTSRILLSVFSDNYLGVIERDLSVADWKPLMDNSPGFPGGGTPLYDAINTMVRSLRDLDPLKCSLLIVTDGEEAGSQYTDKVQAKAMLDWCRAKGWQVTFIGCDFNSDAVSGLLGGNRESSISVSKQNLSTATRALGKKRVGYDLYGTPMHWSEEEQQTFGGFLPDGTKG